MKSLNCSFAAMILIALVQVGCGGGGSKSKVPDTPQVPLASTDASLIELNASAADFDQIFQGSMYSYSGTASYLSRSTTITAKPRDDGAVFEINGIAGTAGQPSDAIELLEGSNIVTVTVTAEDGISSQSYSIDISRNNAGSLASQNYFKAENTGGSDWFGSRIAIEGDILVVAANGDDSSATGIDGDAFNDNASGSGAVFVFRRDAAGTWMPEAYLKASNAEYFDDFGTSIALSGDTLAVSAFHEDSASDGIDGDQSDNGAVDSGAVYVFTRDAFGIWTQQAYLKASNVDAGDGFGAAIALDGDTLVIGAPLEDSSAIGVDGDPTDNASRDSGAAYVFVRDGSGTWSQAAYLKASNTGAGDRFGQSVALSGDSLAIGAPYEASKTTGIDGDQTNNSWSEAGAAYIFTRSAAGIWSQHAYVKASNTGSGDRFGEALAMSADSLVVGAPLEDSAARGINGFQADNKALNSGAAYIFGRSADGTWTQQAYVKSDNSESQDQFAYTLAIHDALIVAGALEDSSISSDPSDNTALDAGAAYVFERDDMGAWHQSAFLKASNIDAGDQFGSAMSTDGVSLVVGARLEDSAATGVGGEQSDNSAADAGAVYLVR